jgi:hypothetical protein
MSNVIRILYPVQHQAKDIFVSDAWVVWKLYNLEQPQKIVAIKFLRMEYDLDLRTAKDVCDAIGAMREEPQTHNEY